MPIAATLARQLFSHPQTRVALCVLIFGGVLICGATDASAGTNTKTTSAAAEISWWGVADDFVYVLKSPSRMSQKDGLVVLALAGVTAGLIAEWDEDIDAEGRRHPGDFPYVVVRKLSELGHEYGRNDTRPVVFFVGLSGCMLAGGLALKDDKLLNTTALLAESFAFTMIATGVVKMMVGRDRPYVENGAREFEYFQFSSDKARRSMFSGHAAAAFAMMTVIAKQYPTWWVRIPAYTVAVGAGLRRIDSRQHWTSDVVLGAVLGYFIASTVVGKHSQDHDDAFSPMPLISPGRVGIAFRF